MRGLVLLALLACDDGGGAEQSVTDMAQQPRGGDVGPDNDSGRVGPDAGPTADAADDDGSTPDGAHPDAAAPEPPDPCGRAAGGDPDADRIVLVGFPFAAQVGEPGTEVGSFIFTADLDLTETGLRVDVGGRPERIAVLPSGRFGLVLVEDGTLHSVQLGLDTLMITDTIGLPNAGWSDIIVDPSGERVHLARSDGGEQGGIYTVDIECDGVLNYREQFFPLRLTDALALFPDDTNRAVALGGQAVFEPIDDDDVRLLSYDVRFGWSEDGAFDIWTDFIDNVGVAISGDGQSVVIPNGSAFSEEGGQIIVATVGEQVGEIARFTDLPDGRLARFAPDGKTALVTRLEPGRVTVLYDDGGGWDVVDEVAGVGLTEDLGIVYRGTASGAVIAPSVSPQDGPQLVILRVIAPGVVERVDTVLLGEGGTRIPDAIGVAP